MKYLLTLLVVLAFAAAVAYAACTTPDQRCPERGSVDDIDLPCESDTFQPTDCSYFDWVFNFDRTDEVEKETTINIKITCSPVDKNYRSSEWTHSESHSDGVDKQGVTNTSFGRQLIISNPGGETGLFSNMVLLADNFR